MQTTFDSLEQYRDYFLSLPISALRVIEVRDYDSLIASVVHRCAPYQVELVLWGPNKTVPPHAHPHIDVLESHISGDLKIVVGDTAEHAVERLKTTRLIPERFATGKFFRIPPGAWHTGEAGPKGVSFWSIQRWVDAPLTAAGVDWVGEKFSDAQNIPDPA